MAGGAQLIGDLLQGAFGGDNINTSNPDTAKMLDQLASQAGYTHKTDADPTTGKPAYFNADTGQYLHDPLSLLPEKQPGFWQRAFAPNDASRANSINSSFATQPTFASQADRTSSMIGAIHAKRVQDFLNGDQSISETDPLTAWDATGHNTSVGGMTGTETSADEYNAGVPSAVAKEGLTSANAITANQTNNKAYAEAFAKLSGPEQEALANQTSNRAMVGRNLSTINHQPALDALTGKQLSLDTGNTDIGLNTLHERAKEAQYTQDLATTIARAKAGVAPAYANTITNEARTGEVASRYRGTPAGPMALQTNPDGTVAYGRTGFLPREVENMQGMMGGKGISGTDASGKKVTLPPMPSRVFNTNDESKPASEPKTQESKTEDDKPKLTPAQAKAKTQQTGIRGGLAEDTEGNVWYNGNIIKGPALEKQQEPDIDFRHINDHLMEGLLK